MIVDDVLRRSSRQTRESLEPIVRGATYVRIQNVADFFWLHEQDVWNTRNDFHCVALPWPTTWMEWKMPVVARFGDDIDPRFGHAYRELGFINLAVVMQQQADPLPAYGVCSELQMIMMSAELGVLGEQSWPVDAEGRIVHVPMGDGQILKPVAFTDVLLRGRRDVATGRKIEAALELTHVFPVLLALSFCHAKNIYATSCEIPRALFKARQRSGAVPVSRFYTLDIGPIQGAIERAKQEHGIGLRQALHLVRGHFKHYTASAPLFGAHTGAYWWGLHARGDSRHGEIRKDYNVVPVVERV